jgi:hypothetical protein
MKKIVKIQFFILLIGAVFAITNFANILFAWLNNKDCTEGCLPPAELTNPFLTPEFYSALFLVLALILNFIILVGTKTKPPKAEGKDKKASEEKIDEPGPDIPKATF